MLFDALVISPCVSEEYTQFKLLWSICMNHITRSALPSFLTVCIPLLIHSYIHLATGYTQNIQQQIIILVLWLRMWIRSTNAVNSTHISWEGLHNLSTSLNIDQNKHLKTAWCTQQMWIRLIQNIHVANNNQLICVFVCWT